MLLKKYANDLNNPNFLEQKQQYLEVIKTRKRTCSICRQQCLSRQEVILHIRELHSGYILCPRKCDKYLNGEDELNNHVKNHDRMCQVCSKVVDRSKLKYHIETVHSETEAKCSACHKIFKSYSLLRHHTNYVHEGVESQCEICAKIFRSEKRLKAHQRLSHTAEEDKKHQCDKCAKRFVSTCDLKDHQMNVHIKARPYSCRYECGGMSYNDPSNRATHEKKKHGEIFTRRLAIGKVANTH